MTILRTETEIAAKNTSLWQSHKFILAGLYREYAGGALQFLQNEHYKYTRPINAILAMTFLAGKKPLISRNTIKLQEIRHY